MSEGNGSTEQVRNAIGAVGVWLFGAAFDEDPPGVAARIASFGYGALWVGGGNTRDNAFQRIDQALGGSDRLVVATGITSIWAWSPEDLDRRARKLELAHPGRFLLGIGVSHANLVEHLGKAYERPFAAMEDYLGGLAGAAAAEPGPRPPVLLAALGDRMLALAAERSTGAHPYFTPVEHTAHAREVLGPDPLLAVEVAVICDEKPETARATARAYTERYLAQPNYVRNLRRLGYGDDDLAGAGSDRLVDAVIGWGSAIQVAARVREHLDAGADHVCIQPLAGGGGIDYPALETLAPLLIAAR